MKDFPYKNEKEITEAKRKVEKQIGKLWNTVMPADQIKELHRELEIAYKNDLERLKQQTQ